MTKKLLGHVGVDSGQLIVTDPCYIDSQWSKVPFTDVRIYQHKKTKRIFTYEAFWGPNKVKKSHLKLAKVEPFQSYNTITSTGKSMNDMIASKVVKEMPNKDKAKLVGSFSYGGICETTMADKHQLKYTKGHPGVAVAFRSGYGDGYYPVYGWFNKEGRCMKVEINMN